MTNLSFPRLLAALALCIGALLVLAIAAQPRQSHAQAATLMNGYAWSDTIGWISLSGAGYGISIDSSGNLSGYGWSENIGWVSAQAADVTGCPTAPCSPKLTGTAFSGWLKAIGATGNGWDGWISLSGTGYGVTNTNGVYAGYAWGSDVVGWLDFSYALPPAPTCTITPSPTTIVRGATASLSWSSTNATSGTITTLGTVAPSGSGQVQPNSTTTYSGSFSGNGGIGSCQATVGVTCAPLYSCNGQTIQYTNAGCTTTNVTTCVSPNYCTPGQSTCTVPPPAFTTSGNLTGHLQAKPSLIRTGSSTVLYWNVTNVSSCAVSGNGDSWSGASAAAATCTHTNGGCNSKAINSTAVYTLSCTALPGGSPNILESVTIVPSPTYKEL